MKMHIPVHFTHFSSLMVLSYMLHRNLGITCLEAGWVE